MNFIEQLGLCDVFLLNLTTTCGGILLSLESNICQISIEHFDQTSIKYFSKRWPALLSLLERGVEWRQTGVRRWTMKRSIWEKRKNNQTKRQKKQQICLNCWFALLDHLGPERLFSGESLGIKFLTFSKVSICAENSFNVYSIYSCHAQFIPRYTYLLGEISSDLYWT